MKISLLKEIADEFSQVATKLESQIKRQEFLAEVEIPQVPSISELGASYLQPHSEQLRNTRQNLTAAQEKLQRGRKTLCEAILRIRRRKKYSLGILNQKRLLQSVLKPLENARLQVVAARAEERAAQIDCKNMLLSIASEPLESEIRKKHERLREEAYKISIDRKNFPKILENLRYKKNLSIRISQALRDNVRRFPQDRTINSLASDVLLSLRTVDIMENESQLNSLLNILVIRVVQTSEDLASYHSLVKTELDRWSVPKKLGLYNENNLTTPIANESIDISRPSMLVPHEDDAADISSLKYSEFAQMLCVSEKWRPEISSLLYWVFASAERDELGGRPSGANEDDITKDLLSALRRKADTLGQTLFELLGYGKRFPFNVGIFGSEQYVTEPEIGADTGIVFDVQLENGVRYTRGVLLQAKCTKNYQANVFRESSSRGRNHQLKALTSRPGLGYYLFYHDGTDGPSMTVRSADDVKGELLSQNNSVDIAELEENQCVVSTIDKAIDLPSFAAFFMFSNGSNFRNISDAIQFMGQKRFHTAGKDVTERLAQRLVLCRIGRAIDQVELNLLQELGFKETLDYEPEVVRGIDLNGMQP
jgi:hypothetical protein